MLQPLYSIYDSKTSVYSPPFVTFNDETAKRVFSSTLRDFSWHKDFLLFNIGTFNDETSECVSYQLRVIDVDFESINSRGN